MLIYFCIILFFADSVIYINYYNFIPIDLLIIFIDSFLL